MLDFLSPRLALRQHPGERIEIERILALARVVLAVSSLAALCLDSTESFGEPNLVLGLVVLYSGHAIALLALLWRWDEVSPRFSWVVQAADILWPCLISFFTNGPDSPFFLYFIFALLAAAFRWGMVEALLTMLVAIAAMPGETFALNHAWFAAPVGRKMRADGSEATLLVPGNVAWPDISHDGQYVLYHALIGAGGPRPRSTLCASPITLPQNSSNWDIAPGLRRMGTRSSISTTQMRASCGRIFLRVPVRRRTWWCPPLLT